MKRFYFIFPIVILCAFSIVYWQFSKASDAAEAERLEKVAKIKLEEEIKKKSDEAKAREDSAKRTAARVAEEAAKEADRIAKWDAESKRIEDETKGYLTQTAAYSQEAASLEKELADLRTKKEAKTRELLDTASEVELSAIAKRNAEFEIQRMTEMIARKTAGTSLLK